MRILYVTPLWSGLKDALFCGCEPMGMPAFTNPLREMIKRGYEIDLVVASSEIQSVNLGVEWLDSSRILFADWDISSPIRALKSIVILYRTVDLALKNRTYDFVYGHGSIGAVANIAALRHHIPIGMRLYGTFLSRELGYGKSPNSLEMFVRKILCFIRHPLEYLSFILPKDFLLVTNDGSRGDYVWQQIGNSQYKWHFWLNGFPTDEATEGTDIVMRSELQHFIADETHFLLYPARIARWKRQHLALDLLEKLIYSEKLELRLVFVGHVTDEGYYTELKEIVQSKGLSDYVCFIGPVAKQELRMLYRHSLAVLSFYDVSNLGNVAIEALSYGCVLVSIDDGTLDSLVVHGESGFLIRDIDEAVPIVRNLLSDSDLRNHVRTSANTIAKARIMSWSERVDQEIELIHKSVAVCH